MYKQATFSHIIWEVREILKEGKQKSKENRLVATVLEEMAVRKQGAQDKMSQ